MSQIGPSMLKNIERRKHMNTKELNTLVTTLTNTPATKPESRNPMTGEEYKTNLRLRRKYPEKEICDAYKRLETVKKVAREFKLDKETVRKILLRNRITIKNTGAIRTSKKVAQLDKDSGEVIQVYDSIQKAANGIGNPKMTQHISDVCHNKQKSAGGYRWKFVTEL